MSELDFELAVKVLRTLAVPQRLAVVVDLLAGAKRPSVLAKRFQISQIRMAEILTSLFAVGILKKVRDGKAVKYDVAGEWRQSDRGISCHVPCGPFKLHLFAA